jgi:hypothetical protein
LSKIILELEEENFMEKNYTELIDALVAGEIKEIPIKQNELIAFRKAWMVHPEKNHVSGIADFGGDITYIYKEEEGI